METCQHEGCDKEGIECFEPSEYGDPILVANAFYCGEHAHEHGYCWGCGEFWAGVASFDFDPDGLCDNCRDDMEAEDDDTYEPGDYDDEFWERE